MIDVVIPVYNGSAYIIHALASVITQTVMPHSIIVVDDGSTDETARLVLEYASQCAVPIVLIQKTNAGLSSARNAGIAKCTAEYIAFLDADDTWERTKLEKQLQIYTTTHFSNLGLVYCDYDLIDTTGNRDRKSYKVPLDQSVQGAVFHKLVSANKILSSGSGVLIKRSVFDSVGIFDETLRFGEDWDMWLRIAERYDVAYSTDVLVHIRRHGNNMTGSKRNVFIGELAFYKKWIPLLKKEGCPVPLRWRIKVLYRLLQQLPHTDLIRDALPVLLVPFGQSIHK